MLISYIRFWNVVSSLVEVYFVLNIIQNDQMFTFYILPTGIGFLNKPADLRTPEVWNGT